MNNKVKNSVEAIFCGFMLFLFFLPNFYTYIYSPVYGEATQVNINFFEVIKRIKDMNSIIQNPISNTDEYFCNLMNTLFVIIICLTAILLILCLIQLIMNKNWGVSVCLPIVELVLLLVFSFYLDEMIGYEYDAMLSFRLSIWFYVEVLLLISFSIYSFICYRIVIKYGDKIKECSYKNISAADEIKKFKELLDNGVITQDEFQTKKEELLNQ